MGYVIAYPTADGSEVVVEVEDAPAGTERASRRRAVPKLEETVEDALGTVRSAADAVLSTLDRLTRTPDEATVEFGVKFSAQAGAIIVSTDAEAHLTVTLKWTRGSASELSANIGSNG